MTPSGLLVVDKPPGMTSHDVVARVRRLAGTRRVGHAGTLDPMATGVLVVGVEKATRLLGLLTLTEKAYDATVRFGIATSTYDAEGEVVAVADATGLDDVSIRAAFAALVGEIEQVPPAVSAIKVGGVRSYKLAREGAEVVLPPRRVTVHELSVGAIRRSEGEGVVDVDIAVRCGSGTYIRSLAHDAGATLGVGGHLTALRRTAVGPYGIRSAVALADLDVGRDLVPIADAAAVAFPRWDVPDDVARAVTHGQRIQAASELAGPTAVFGPDGALLALVEPGEGDGAPVRYLAVFV